jgi:mono/diheme cytochrome c family protein
MDKASMKPVLLVAAGLLGSVAFFILLGLVIAYTGSYNIAATEEHASITRWAFNTALHQSVDRHAAAITVPEHFTPEMIAVGALEYKQMCEHCHAGPGVERASWASAMRPRPPHLAEAASEWKLAEVFWLARHGVKMTGMPAFGPTHDDRTLWNIAAFVKKLPAMAPEEYAAFDGGERGRHTHDRGEH